MTRWSLRRHRHRAQRPGAGTYRVDPARPEPEFAPPAGYRPADGHAPGGYPPAAYRPDAYGPGAPDGYPRTRPGAAQPHFPQSTWPFPAGADKALPPAGGAWPDVMEQFGLHLLVLAEQLRVSLDDLESDEADPERLQKLYKVDHAVTRIRRASRDLRTLAGRAEEELAGIDTSLLDVIRVALSAIDRYTQVSIGRVADFGVLGYAADDIASMLAALLDNATRYSPGMASISAHLTEDGSVLFRIEDSGIGMSPDGVAALNAMLAGDVPELDDRTGRHTGFPVVHRIARQYSAGVRLAARPAPGNGTIALVTLPPELLCEMPDDADAPPQAPPPPRPRQASVAVLPTTRRADQAQPRLPRKVAADGAASTGLPRREPGSLRGKPRPRPGAAAGFGSGDAGQEARRSPAEQAAARQAFADDLAAFSLGTTQDTAVPGPERRPGSQDPKGTQP